MRSKRAKQLRREILHSIKDGVVSPHEIDKKYKQAKKDWVRNPGKQFPKLETSKRQQRINGAKLFVEV